MGRLLIGTDLRGTQCDRFGRGELRLVGYGDSSGGYAFTPANQDAAIAPSLSSANLSNIANSIPQLTEQQDFAGKWIDTITLHALDEFIEQTEPQSFIANTLRIFAGGQKGYREDGTGRANVRNTYTLLAEISIPALTRADIPRSFPVKAGVYVPPAQNLYLGLATPQPYTCSFEMWDLQANTLVGSGVSASIGGSPTVSSGNDLIEENPNTPVDTQFVLPISFASATWKKGVADSTVTPPPPTPLPTPPTGTSSPSPDPNPGSPSPSSPSSPTAPSPSPSDSVPPPTAGGCTPIQNCTWHTVTSAQSAQVDMNLNGGTNLCPAGTIARGVVDFETAGSFVLCCTPATFPPNNLGCSSLNRYSCSGGGVCVLDAFGSYSSLAQCQAALIPPPFTGGQCAKTYYFKIQVTTDAGTFYDAGSGNGSPVNTSPISDAAARGGTPIMGPLNNISFVPFSGGSGLTRVELWRSGAYAGYFWLSSGAFQTFISASVTWVEPVSGLDNCGNLPSTCP